MRVDVELESDGEDTYTLEDGGFTLTTDKGDSLTPNLSSAPWETPTGKLLPGDERRGGLGFLVPDGAEPEELRFEPVIGAEVIVRWNIES